MCTVTSDSIYVSWKITPRWEGNPKVINKFVVSWFPYQDEHEQSSRRMELYTKERSTQSGSQVTDYELLTEEEHKEDPNFLYTVLSEARS